MFFSIIIPLKRINRCLIHEALPALARQTCCDFEAIVLPNEVGRSDNKLLQQRYPWLKIIPTGKITRPAEKRNLGIKIAKGNIIAFIDDDAYPSVDWLENARRALRAGAGHGQPKGPPNRRAPTGSNGIVAVCGPGLLPRKTNIWEKIFDSILRARLGSGQYTYRFQKEKTRFVDDYPLMNFFIRKNIFQKLKGLQGKHYPGEDSKLCEDLVYRERKKILYSPKITVYHHRRNNLIDFLRQHARYGRQRGKFFREGDRNSRRPIYLLPSVFVLYLLFMFMAAIINQKALIFIIWPLALYILGSFYLIGRVLKQTKNIAIAIGASFSMFLMHLVYGTAFILGLL